MKGAFFTGVLVLSLCGGLSAQSSEDTVSKSDLAGATAQMKAELRKLDKKAAEREAETRKQAEILQRKNAEEQARLREEIARTDRERKEAETRQLADAEWRRNIAYGVGGIGFLALTALGVFVARRFSRPVVRTVTDRQQADTSGILLDPPKAELEKYSANNGRMNPVPFKVKLEEYPEPLLCYAQLRESQDPLIVEIDGKKHEGLGWKNHKQKIGKFLSRETAA
jgi:hypothetical protein